MKHSVSSSSLQSKLIVILGPTACGKSRLAIDIAKKFNGEIVNADSRQVYQEMDIATGKIDKPSDRKIRDGNVYICGIRHHLIDVVPPDKPFSLAQYQQRAFEAIGDIIRRKKIPILVGGTGLYIRSVIDNLDIPKVKPNHALRNRLEGQTPTELHTLLQILDPKTGSTIDQRNKRRLVRALEVVFAKRTSFYDLQKTRKPRYEVLQISPTISRDILDKRIQKRFVQMLRSGLLKEAKGLLERYSLDLPSMSGIGYAEIGRYLQGKLTLEQAIERAIIRTRQYTRRQMTWFRRDDRIHRVLRPSQARSLVSAFLSDKRYKLNG